MNTTDKPVMIQWTIYKHPADYPDKYVVRAWGIFRGSEPRPSGIVFQCHTLEDARNVIPPGLVCMQPDPATDVPCIVETWI